MVGVEARSRCDRVGGQARQRKYEVTVGRNLGGQSPTYFVSYLLPKQWVPLGGAALMPFAGLGRWPNGV